MTFRKFLGSIGFCDHSFILVEGSFTLPLYPSGNPLWDHFLGGNIREAQEKCEKCGVIKTVQWSTDVPQYDERESLPPH